LLNDDVVTAYAATWSTRVRVCPGVEQDLHALGIAVATSPVWRYQPGGGPRPSRFGSVRFCAVLFGSSRFDFFIRFGSVRFGLRHFRRAAFSEGLVSSFHGHADGWSGSRGWPRAAVEPVELTACSRNG
ncbi:unnamed protein product, partial [Laminaria digitata]